MAINFHYIPLTSSLQGVLSIGFGGDRITDWEGEMVEGDERVERVDGWRKDEEGGGTLPVMSGKSASCVGA